MVFQMIPTCVLNVLTLVFFIFLNAETLARTLQLEPLQNGSELHRCIPTAKLIQGGTDEDTTLNSSISQNSDENAYPNNYDHSKNPDYQKQDTNVMSMSDNTESIIHYKDTPLGTVNIEATQKDSPLVFRKKNRLPELRHDVSFSRKLSTSPSVIVIKPSTQSRNMYVV